MHKKRKDVLRLTFHCIELEVQNVYTIMGHCILLFDINFIFISSAIHKREKKSLIDRQKINLINISFSLFEIQNSKKTFHLSNLKIIKH